MAEVLAAPVPVPQEKYTAAQVIQVLEASRGMVTTAAKVLGCDRTTIYNYRDKYPEVRDAMDAAQELQLDVAELNLFKAIDRMEPWSICFYLKTKGRNRGYVEKHEVTGPMTMAELVKLIAEDPKPEPKLING